MTSGRILLAAVIGGVTLLACVRTPTGEPPPQVPGGDPGRGAALIASYGCGACHVIPGIAGARGTVGPPLTDFSQRGYIAGELPNNASNLVTWIVDPPSVEPGTAMPNLGVTPTQARDIAAYLFTLK